MKITLVLVGFFCCISLGTVFAKKSFSWPMIVELNSGNITTTYGCSIVATFCDITNRGITDIATNTFINHPNLEVLRLGDNQITSLENGDFNGLTSLTELWLSYNKIPSLENGDFNGLTNIRFLSLQSNQITSLENGDFNGLTTLTSLSLYDNLLTSLENGDFNGLTNLQRLSLNTNQITSLENGDFNGLTNLMGLGLDINRITSIESGDFSGIPNLQSLTFGANQITSLERGDFAGLSNLGDLNLQQNPIISIQSGTFIGLSALRTLNFQGTQLTTIDSGTFLGLSALKTLSLYFNQITDIPTNTFAGVPTLENLTLGYNRLTSLENGDFNGLSNLLTLYVHYNQITSIENGDFNGIGSNLNMIRLSDNHMTSIQNGTFAGFPLLSVLNIIPSCNTSGTVNIVFPGGTSPTNNGNCVPLSGNTASNFITMLLNKAYSLSGAYYLGQLALSFNYPTATNRFLANVIMHSENPNEYTQAYYQNRVEIQYTSGTTITANGQPFTGILHHALLFATGTTPGLTNVITLMRFGSLRYRADFSLPITIRMPALGKTPGDIVKIYSSDKENIYGAGGPSRVLEKTGIVTNIGGIPYVEFTATHTSRFALKDNTKNNNEITLPIQPAVDVIIPAEKPIIRIREGGGRGDTTPAVSTTTITTLGTATSDIISSLSTELQGGTTSLLQTTLE